MAGLSLYQFKYYIVKPSLEYLGDEFCSPASINLLVGTALSESNLTFLSQKPNGPATSLWQIEEPTYDDTLNRIAKKRPDLITLINSASCGAKPSYEQLIYNLKLSCIVARLKYWLIPAAMPTNDALSLSRYHKAWYNTPLGKADQDKNTKNFQLAIST